MHQTDEANGIYSVSCRTENGATVPAQSHSAIFVQSLFGSSSEVHGLEEVRVILMGKKKILFINGHLNAGGVERSLVDVLRHFDYGKYDVDLL